MKHKFRLKILFLTLAFFINLLIGAIAPMLSSQPALSAGPVVTLVWVDNSTIKVTGSDVRNSVNLRINTIGHYGTSNIQPSDWDPNIFTAYVGTVSVNTGGPNGCPIDVFIKVRNPINSSTTTATPVDTGVAGSSCPGLNNPQPRNDFQSAIFAKPPINPKGSGGGQPQTKNAIWINHSVIEIDGKRYVDHKIDDDLTFVGEDNCSKISGNGSDDTEGKWATAGSNMDGTNFANATSHPTFHFYNGSCQEQNHQKFRVNFISSGINTISSFNFYFWWCDQANIRSSDAVGYSTDGRCAASGTLALKASSPQPAPAVNNYERTSGDQKCKTLMQATIGKSEGTLTLKDTNSDRTTVTGQGWLGKINSQKNNLHSSNGCYVSDAIGRTPIGNAFAGAALAPDAGISTPPTSGSGDSSITCESSGFSLSFFLCPVINGLADASDQIYSSFIKPLLETPTLDVSGNSSMRTVWNQFRLFGNVVLVIALLVVIFGQAIGGGLIDAYTAKKVLPRILIAAVLINLSIYIVAVVIDVTNLVGRSLNNLIIDPFVQAGQDSFRISGTSSGVLGFGAIAGAAGSVWALATHAAAVIQFLFVFILLPAIITFIAILATLVLRLGIIEFLVIISPVAFALYCLPNTERYYKQWWSLLFRTALVYPIVAVVFAMSNVLAVTIGGANSPVPLVLDIIKIVLVLIPLFLIPFAFKLSGGMIGSLYGTLSGLGKKTNQAIRGNPNDPLSLGRRARANMGHAVVDARAGLQNRTRTVRGLRTVGRFVGGGAGIYARQAVNNQETAQLIQTTGDFGNDAYVRGATVPLSMLRQRSGPRYRAAGDGHPEQWQSAEGTWLDEQQIRGGHRYYGTEAAHQNAFKYVLSKAEFGTPQQQDRVFQDFIAYANEDRMEPQTASGRWQGIAIPHKGFRLDLRRRTIQGTTGNLTAGDVNHAGFLQEYGGMSTYEQVKETEGTFSQLTESINHALNPGASPEEQQYVDNAVGNLQRYVGGQGVPAPADAPEELRQQYAASSSDAWKNSQAARQALVQIQTSHPELFAPGGRFGTPAAPPPQAPPYAPNAGLR